MTCLDNLYTESCNFGLLLRVVVKEVKFALFGEGVHATASLADRW